MSDLPHDLDIEGAILNCFLKQPDLIRGCDIHHSAFFGDFNARVYRTMRDLEDEGAGPDLLLVATALRDAGDEFSGAKLGKLQDIPCNPSRFGWYRAQLNRLAYQREQVRISETVASMAKDNATEDELDAARARMETKAHALFRSHDESYEPDVAKQELRRWYQTLKQDGVSLGYSCLDEIVGDLYPGMVVTCLARPGIGKSVFGLNLIHAWLKLPASWGCMFASLEMGTTLATDRLIRIIEGWSKMEIRHAMLSGKEPEQYDALTEDRYLIYAKSRQPVEAIEHGIASWERKHDRKIRCLVVDYFQYLRGEKNESPYERGSRLSRELKELAKDRNLVLVNLCQVKRGPEGGKGTECPSLEAARDSGTIEENADVVIGLWRTTKPHELMFRGLKVREGRPDEQCTLFHDTETDRLFEPNN